MTKIRIEKSVRPDEKVTSDGQMNAAPESVRDSGKVRMGSMISPFKALPANMRDGGKVRMGNMISAFKAEIGATRT